MMLPFSAADADMANTIRCAIATRATCDGGASYDTPRDMPERSVDV